MLLAPPMRFRFHPDDHERYGSDWVVYDEAALTRLPWRELVEIELQIGMGVSVMMRRARRGFTDADAAAMWIARRLAGVDEPFDDFAPMVLLADWAEMPAGDGDPPALSSSSSETG